MKDPLILALVLGVFLFALGSLEERLHNIEAKIEKLEKAYGKPNTSDAQDQ